MADPFAIARDYLKGLAGEADAITQDVEADPELLRRVRIFREQAESFIRQGLTLPILSLSEHQGREGCISCGNTVEGGCFRCSVCTLAVKLALDGRP